jgi:hypothetical protein
MVCDQEQEICHELRCGDLRWGIIYCLPCLESGKVRAKIMNQMIDGKFVPCISFINTQLKFYRKTQNAVVDAKVLGSSRGSIAFIGDELSLLLSYEDDFGVSRHVTLANILKHSPEFYDQIVSCDNFLKGESIVNPANGYSSIEDVYKCQVKNELVKNEIVISYQDTPDWFKLAVENAQLLAKVTASCYFNK